MPVSALPTPPARIRPTTFSVEMDAFLAALSTFQADVNALEVTVNSQEAEAQAWAVATSQDAVTCQGAAASAVATVGATVYSGSTTYNFPNTVICVDGGTYRCVGTGVIGDNPVGSTSGDWLMLTVAIPTLNIKTQAFAISSNITYFADTTAGAFSATLPASPVSGHQFSIGDYAGTWGTNNLTVARNGHKIMGLEEDLALNINTFVTLIYVNSTVGWRVL